MTKLFLLIIALIRDFNNNTSKHTFKSNKDDNIFSLKR